MLSEYLGIPIVSTGQLLRDISDSHPWYKEIHEAMKKGALADQIKVASLLKEELAKEQYSCGYIIDGWFRSMTDVETYEPALDQAILLIISPETTIKRLGTRRTCSSCGQIFNIVSLPPKIEGICDTCGGKLVQRDDDTKEAIMKRLEIYNTDTKEVLQYLKDKNILEEVDGEGSPKEVFDLIVKRFGW